MAGRGVFKAWNAKAKPQPQRVVDRDDFVAIAATHLTNDRSSRRVIAVASGRSCPE